VVRAGWNNFRSMVIGVELQTVEVPALEPGEEETGGRA